MVTILRLLGEYIALLRVKEIIAAFTVFSLSARWLLMYWQARYKTLFGRNIVSS